MHCHLQLRKPVEMHVPVTCCVASACGCSALRRIFLRMEFGTIYDSRQWISTCKPYSFDTQVYGIAAAYECSFHIYFK